MLFRSDLPFNQESLYDLILRNLTIKNENKASLIDIGINNNEDYDENSGNTKIISCIEEIGDLTNFYGNEECDLAGYYAEPTSERLRIGDTANILIKKNEQIKYKIANGNLINSDLH